MRIAFAALQKDFAAALLDPERVLPRGVTSHTSTAPAKRFAVYRNNVVAGLVYALRTRFPAVEKIVGDEFFAAMARVFIARHPPRSKLLTTYGDDFPSFIAAFEHAADLPYLPDVARLEAARTRAYHAADAAPAAVETLAKLDPAMLAGTRIALHPSAQIVRSQFAIVAIWAMNSGEAAIREIDASSPEDALVLRPSMQVIVRKLPPGGGAFLLAIAAGKTLGEAATAGADDYAQFDLVANLAGLISSGVFAGFATPNNQKD